MELYATDLILIPGISENVNADDILELIFNLENDMNIIRKAYSSSRSLLIFSVIVSACSFSIAFGIQDIIDSSSDGGLILSGLIFSVVLAGVLGAIFGTLMWAMVFEPQRKDLERRKKEQAKYHLEKNQVPIPIKNIFFRRRLNTKKATLIYSVFICERLIVPLWIAITVIITFFNKFTLGQAIIIGISGMVFGLVVSLYVWVRFYEPMRKRIESEIQSVQVAGDGKKSE